MPSPHLVDVMCSELVWVNSLHVGRSGGDDKARWRLNSRWEKLARSAMRDLGEALVVAGGHCSVCDGYGRLDLEHLGWFPCARCDGKGYVDEQGA